MSRLLLASVVISAAALSIAACGGQVVFVEDDDGSGGSSSSSKSSTTGGPTGKSSSSGSTTPSSGVTSVVTTGGPQLCALGEFSGPCSSCIEDVSQSQCQPLLNECFDMPGCTQLSDCITKCFSDAACCEGCDSAYGQEAVDALYKLLDCMYCQGCKEPCQDALPGFCGG
jgi:hypothetical protein